MKRNNKYNWHRNHTVPHCQHGAGINNYDSYYNILYKNIIIAIQLLKNAMTVPPYYVGTLFQASQETDI